jgi:hypothetical protein
MQRYATNKKSLQKANLRNKRNNGGRDPEQSFSLEPWKPTTHHFKRHVDLGNVALSSAGISTNGFSFQLDEVPNYTEFTTLFDLYKIEHVELHMIPSANSANTLTGIGGAINYPPRIATVIDYNSSTGFASFDDARDFESAEVVPAIRRNPIVRKITPKFLTGVEEDGATIVTGGASRGWLNTARADVPHYGFRYVAEQLTSATEFIGFRCEAIYYLSMKAVK